MQRIVTIAAVLLAAAGMVYAHCDTMDGPVIIEAQAALERGDVTPMLKWVRAEDEAEIKHSFEQAQAVRKLGPQAKEVADMRFLETLIRIHRAGEGAPYTGIKPAGTEIDHAVAAADKGLEKGTDGGVTDMLTGAMRQGIQTRLDRVRETKQHANDSVAAGREYVAAYVEYVHYVEALHQAIIGKGAGCAEPAAAGHAH
ncbi:MAG: DUF6448 family protein [Armatimonadota bacterium]